MEAAVTEEHNKVVSISMQTIIVISNAVEAKNINVGKHSLRVAHFSCLIVEKMGWPEDEIRRLHTIAMLHEVDAGANYHHEHYDGKGYPEWLKGLNIPIEARIICVADSFDSMKNSRGVKVSLDKDSIKNELIKDKGSSSYQIFRNFYFKIFYYLWYWFNCCNYCYAIGGSILKDLTLIPNIDLGAKSHHERFDGRGYPEVIYERLSLVNIFIILYFSFILLLCLIL